MTYKTVTHCIFDMDGLLLDTEGLYQKILSDLVAKYSKVYTDDVRMKVMGTTENDTIGILITELDLPVSKDQLTQDYKELHGIISDAGLLPGVERLVRHLHKCGISICVATSSSKRSVDIKLKNHSELFGLFHHIVCGSSDPDVKNGKPNPDIFLIAANRFDDHPSPEKCLVFEDSVNGVKAAIAAGMQVVMVPDPMVTEDSRALATVVLGSLEGFKPQLFGLPPY